MFRRSAVLFGWTLMTLFLFGGCGPRVIVIQTGPPPPWVDKMPKHEKKLCAVGYSGPTFYQTDCLKNAADNARGQLAECISVSIKTITVDISDGTRGSFDQDTFVQGSQSASDCVLNGSEVEAQWLDISGQRGSQNGCYSMVCIDPNKPLDKLVESLKDKKLPPKTVEKVRANAQAAFDELEKAEGKAQEKKAPVPTPPVQEKKSAEPPTPSPPAPSDVPGQEKEKPTT
jgi:hypothetical protein